MNKLIATGLAACLVPTGLAAEDPAAMELMVSENVMVIEESTPVATDLLCARSSAEANGADCMAVHRAVLTARMQKVSLRERGRWM